MEGFVENLTKFLKSFGDDGKSELNTYCPKHELVLVPQETTEFAYSGLELKDDTLRIVFAEGRFGRDLTSASRNVAQALRNAPPPSGVDKPALNIIARYVIREDYDPKIEK